MWLPTVQASEALQVCMRLFGSKTELVKVGVNDLDGAGEVRVDAQVCAICT